MEKIRIKKELYILRYDFWKFLPFSDFYLLFKLNFLFKNRKKGEYLPAGADVASGEAGELTRGARDHRADATRLWGHVAGPRVTHAGRRRRKARPRGKGPCDNAGPRGRPCGAPRGRGVRRWRAHGYSGPW